MPVMPEEVMMMIQDVEDVDASLVILSLR